MPAKYQQIYAALKEQIQKGEVPSGTYLPSENELMTAFDASRDTIRKALGQLANAGLIQKEKGKGSLVLDQNQIAFPLSGLTSFKELEKALIHGNAITHVISFEEIDPDPAMVQDLHIESGLVDEIRRVREINGERIIYDHDFVIADLIPGLTKEHAANSLYEYIEKELGLIISFACKEITVVPATEEDARLLDLKGFDMVVCVRSYNFLDDAGMFCFTESRHRPDKFRFVDFSRRDAAL